ncbi:T9SS type A sorting domain-containing protein [Hymenobacter persicinus]|uniref:T9SS type A sorting domain-containing protein n=1 Tax=Hymenobacter persicinus TaxID=2025506 RepID=A0A4Q5L7Z8_9BACT|nr:T9SS type A sorting domain-containing protein [Hymenobacter persicinus]RYU77737.1 T9SS type A sorting domain-containing protein [Hymenobacter persicinus]
MVLFTRSIAQLRALPVAALVLGLSLSAQAQTPIAITGGTSIYSQNFDGLTPTGTTYPAGWAGLRYARSSTNTTAIINEALNPVVLADGSNAGAVYNAGPNAGSTGDTDRALGSLASASTYPAYGAVFVNNSGAAITRVSMAGRAEQWRTGSNNTVNETIVFEYSLDATNLNSGTTATWVPVTSLDLTELAITSTVAGPLDGNAAANSRPIAGVITGINWPAGGTMWIRWRDNDDLGSDALLAVDNFALATGNTVLAARNQALENTLSVFPNPATSKINLTVGQAGVGAAVEIFNALGQRVQHLTATQAQFSVDVAALKAGVYTVRFTTAEGAATRSFVKQ